LQGSTEEAQFRDRAKKDVARVQDADTAPATSRESLKS
jgi:hypothetical protein